MKGSGRAGAEGSNRQRSEGSCERCARAAVSSISGGSNKGSTDKGLGDEPRRPSAAAGLAPQSLSPPNEEAAAVRRSGIECDCFASIVLSLHPSPAPSLTRGASFRRRKPASRRLQVSRIYLDVFFVFFG